MLIDKLTKQVRRQRAEHERASSARQQQQDEEQDVQPMGGEADLVYPCSVLLV